MVVTVVVVDCFPPRTLNPKPAHAHGPAAAQPVSLLTGSGASDPRVIRCASVLPCIPTTITS